MGKVLQPAGIPAGKVFGCVATSHQHTDARTVQREWHSHRRLKWLNQHRAAPHSISRLPILRKTQCPLFFYGTHRHTEIKGFTGCGGLNRRLFRGKAPDYELQLFLIEKGNYRNIRIGQFCRHPHD